MTTVRPDWYDDPEAADSGLLRYWDGTSWTEHVHDVSYGQPPLAPPDRSTGSTPAQGPARRSATVPLVGARRFARELLDANDVLSREVSRLHEIIDEFGVENAVDRTIRLEDLNDEIATQHAQLSQLIAQVNETRSRLVAQTHAAEARHTDRSLRPCRR